jgi:hypothetical protein
MRGANGSTAGARGLVPKPAAADNVKYLKGDGSWSALSNASAATNAEAAAGTSTTTFVTPANAGFAVAGKTNGLAPAQGLVFDGTASIPYALAATGTNAATFHFCFNPSATALSANARLLGASSAYQLLLASSGAQFYTVGGSVYSAALTANTWTVLTLVINGNGTAVIYTNGVAGTSGSITANLSTAWDTIGGLSSANVFSGALRPAFFNRALSAAEVLALYQSGAPAGADYNTASNTNAGSTWLNSGVGYSSFTSGSATGFTATATGLSYAGNNIVQAQKVGARWLVKFNVSVASGSGPASLVPWNSGGFGSTVAGSQAVASGDNSIVITGTANQSSNWFLTFQSLAAGTFTVSGFSITPLGLLLAPDSNNAGAGLEWLDVSGNRAHIVLPTSGVSWSLPSSQQIVIEASTATNGNQQLGGAALIDVNKQWRIQSWTVNCSTGTPTISLGNASAGAQYVSALVLAAGNNDITLLARFPATANLWASSSTTATLIHRIVLVPAN